MKLPAEQYRLLEDTYLRYFPVAIPDECLSDYNSIILYKNLLKRTMPDQRILNRLVNVLGDKIKGKQRYQKMTMLKLIKQQLHSSILQKEIVDNLFFIFQSLIIEANEEVGWKLTTMIKDVELSKEQIDWLVDHQKESFHITNRLLRYPKANKAIYEWALKCLSNDELESRLSELIGIQLNFNKKYKHSNNVAYVWGVHYSKLDERVKKDLLLKAVTLQTIDEVIRISERNCYMDIIAFLYSKCD
ncbi:MAG: hypothetical protein ABI675_25755 [Chitinophagaceae bacterium]